MNNDIPDITGHFDQLEMSVIHSAKVIASYYETLIKDGVPDQLAYSMTMDFHHLYWIKNLGIDTE